MSESDDGYSKPDGIFHEDNRSPTDKYWLIPLGICFVIFIGISGYSINQFDTVWTHFNPNETTHGRACGLDSDVLDKPNKIFIDQRMCDKRNQSDIENFLSCTEPYICVKDCPKGTFDVNECINTDIENLKKKIVCSTDTILKSITNCAQLRQYIDDQKCLKWYKNTDETFGTCHSNTKDSDMSDKMIIADTFSMLKGMILPFICAMLLGIVLSSIFIIVLKWAAGCVFWSFIGFIGASLVSGIISAGVILGTSKNEHKAALIIPLIVLSLFFLVFIWMIYYFRNKIRCGIEIVKEASHAVCSSVASICFPILPYILRAIIAFFLVAVIIFAILVKNYEYEVQGKSTDISCQCSKTYLDGEMCYPKEFNQDCKDTNGGFCLKAYCKLSDVKDPWYSTPFIVIAIFTGMWVTAFIQANTKMILAHVFGNWYWNYNKEMTPANAIPNAMGIILGNHTGTASFGSLIITICRILKSLLSRRERSGNDIAAIIMTVIMECIKACARALLEIIEFISDKAFVLVAIQGTGFWESVKGVSKIMVKDIPLVIATEYVGDIILGVCKFLVAILAAALFFCMTTIEVETITEEMEQTVMMVKILMTIFVFVFTFDLASILLTSYDVAIDTLLVCALQDFAHSNGAHKKYFASDSLNELLIKPAPA